MEGTLKQTGELFTNSVAYDARGASVETWVSADATVPCLIQQRAGEMVYSEERQKNIPVLHCFLRRDLTIVAGNKLVVDGESYLVRAVIAHRWNAHHREAILERMEGHR